MKRFLKLRLVIKGITAMSHPDTKGHKQRLEKKSP